MKNNVILITGCSTGIGRELAERLTADGHTVIATARKPDTVSILGVAAVLALDVTDAASIAAAVSETITRFGRIDMLINNAGYATRGAVEDVPIAQVSAMFDVNVFGVMRMITAVAPHMRAQKSGRIVTIGSIGGKVSIPVNGTYSATKFAVEALCDAARLELAPFGIKMILIEPGNIRSAFLERSLSLGNDTLHNPSSPYRPLYDRYAETSSRLRMHQGEPEAVYRAVKRVIESNRPKARYLVAVPMATTIARYVPDGIRDRIFTKLFCSKNPTREKT